MSGAHPGTVTYVDADAGTEQIRPIEQVPEALRFADTDAGPVPVVRVVARRRGAGREVLEYGPNGQLLRTTVQRGP